MIRHYFIWGIMAVMIGVGSDCFAENMPLVSAVPVKKAMLSQAVIRQAIQKEDAYVVQLESDLLENSQVGDEVDLIQIGFNHQDLVKGKVIRQVISKTLQTIIIKPLTAITRTGVVQANLKINSDQNIYQIPLSSLRNASGLKGEIYLVNPMDNIVMKETVSILGFDGPNIVVNGPKINEVFWVVISGFHKVMPGKVVRIFPETMTE
jgi:hypothetical protein